MANLGSSLYSDTLRAILIPFRDLRFFTDPAEPLTINLDAQAVSLIRISISGPGAFNVTGAAVCRVGDYASDDPMVPLSAVVRTSAQPDGSAQICLSCNQSPSVESRVEVARTEDPWIVLDLGASHDVTRIVLWSAAMPRQAWARLMVEVSVDGDAWNTVYSTKDRLAELAGLMESIGMRGVLSANDRYAWEVFSEVVALLFRGERRRAEKRLRYSGLPDDVLSEIRIAVTREVLDAMQLDWNHHGIRRTFKYWTTREKVKYIKTANHFIGRMAKELSPHVCLGFGSVLSLVRDQDLIPHDDDLDIIIAFDREDCPTITEGFDRLVAFAAKHGYRLREPSPKSHRQFIREGSRKVDVFVGLAEEGRISWYPQKRGSLALTEVFPPIRASMLGVECLIPRNPLRYLEAVYGPRWSKPDPFFKHDWRTRDYEDIW
jgi:hypothetical protein